MKVKVIILALVLCFCIGSMTMTSMASLYVDSLYLDNERYNHSLSGTKGKFTAMGTVGTNPKSFSSIVNNSSETIRVTISVREIDLVSGAVDAKSKNNVVLAVGGSTATGGVERDPMDGNMKYVHEGRVNKYTDSNTVYDQFAIYVDQIDNNE